MNAAGPRRLGLVLCSGLDQPIPSTRIAVLNMLPRLRAAGWEPVLLFTPERPTETPALEGVAERALAERCDAVLLQKVRGTAALALAQRLRAAGVPTVYAVCDLVDPAMAEATTATVIVTDFLRSLYPAALQPRIHVVHDGIERPEARKTQWRNDTGSAGRPLAAVLVTSAELNALPALGGVPPWLALRIVGRYAAGRERRRQVRWAFAAQPWRERLAFARFLLNRRIACVPWSAEGVYAEMAAADIGVIPVDTGEPGAAAGVPPAWQVKSENRLTLKMSMGLPVIATPIPSYEPIIEHGVNGFFARTPADWRTCLQALRDPARRREMGAAARARVERTYSMDAQGRRLAAVLQGVAAAADAPHPRAAATPRGGTAGIQE